jgi:hypothetical protein
MSCALYDPNGVGFFCDLCFKAQHPWYRVPHVYMDINIINNDNSSKAPINLTYRDTRDIAIIQDPSEYYLSVVRFHLDTQSALPLMIPQVQLAQNDPNLSVYSFTLKYQTYVYQINIPPCLLDLSEAFLFFSIGCHLMMLV